MAKPIEKPGSAVQADEIAARMLQCSLIAAPR